MSFTNGFHQYAWTPARTSRLTGRRQRSICFGHEQSRNRCRVPQAHPAQREEIQPKLAELDGQDWLDEDDPLTDGEKALIEARLEAHEVNPAAAVQWDEFNERLRRRLG